MQVRRFGAENVNKLNIKHVFVVFQISEFIVDREIHCMDALKAFNLINTFHHLIILYQSS